MNEPMIYIKEGVFKQKHTSHKVMYSLVDKNIVNRGWQEPDAVFSSGAVVQYWLIQCSWPIM